MDNAAVAQGLGSQRIGTVEREHALDLLGECLGEGRLDPHEHEQRADAIIRSRTRDDLAAVFVDLPVSPIARTPLTPAPSTSRHQPARTEETSADFPAPFALMIAAVIVVVTLITQQWWWLFALFAFAPGKQCRRRRA